jgi:hypothetical protein
VLSVVSSCLNAAYSCRSATSGSIRDAQREFVGMIAPSVEPGGAGAVKVLVAENDVDQAPAIVEDFVKQDDAAAFAVGEIDGQATSSTGD